MTYAMQRVMSEGTAQQSYYGTSPRVPMIGKTGTTDDAKDTWMSGASAIRAITPLAFPIPISIESPFLKYIGSGTHLLEAEPDLCDCVKRVAAARRALPRILGLSTRRGAIY